ncbi:hypothetical protein ACMFMG_001185 [Clarireedia jacksonii]
MNLPKWLRGVTPSPVQAKEVETDDVFPVHPFDDIKTFRRIMLGWTMRFNDVLDAEKLHDSLTKLLQIGDWRKLGGRYRLTPNGKLAVHVPREFTLERPAVRFSQCKFDIPIAEHPLASQLPIATNQPFTQTTTNKFRSFVARADAPKTVDDLLHRDEPLISLHITSFLDATLVGLLVPHTMTDIMGISAIMEAWTLILAGRHAEVLQLHGARDDIIDEIIKFSDDEQQPLILASEEITGLNLLRMGYHFFRDLYLGPKPQAKTIYLPQWFVSQLWQRANEDLSPTHTGEKPPFISEGDVLAAWIAHAVADSPSSQHRPIDAFVIADFRRLKSFFTPRIPYVQNLLVYTHALFSVKEVSQSTLGHCAYKIRKDIQQQVTEHQVSTWLRKLKTLGYPAIPPLFGKPDSVILVITNWTKANFFEVVDFSPAIVRSETLIDRSMNLRGKIVYHNSQVMVNDRYQRRNFVNVLGKDLAGNYWLKASLTPDTWKNLERDMKQAGVKS